MSIYRMLGLRGPALHVLVLGALALGFVSACSDDPQDLQGVTFMAGFRPQANLPFVAAYVADANGYFEDEGLDVDIQHSSGQNEHLRLIVDGSVKFSTGTAAQVLRRQEEDLPFSGIALFGQRGDQGYVARADSGIAGPADFEGHSVGFKGGVVPTELIAMLAQVGLTEDDVELVAVGFDPAVFVEGGVDVYPVFLGNEPDTIRRAGIDINVIDPHDFGVPTLGLTFITNNETLEGDPELVERFLRATLKASAWIAEHPDEAVEVVLEYAEGADAEHQRFLLDVDLANAAREDGIGRSDAEQWDALADLLVEYGVVAERPDVARSFDGSIVDRLYEDGEITSDER